MSRVVNFKNLRIFAYLRVNEDANNLAVTDHLAEVIFDGLLAEIIGPLLAGLGESLLLARVPVEWFPRRLAKGRKKRKQTS
jgi:hypothetical protein